MGAVISVDLDQLPEALDLGERKIRRAVARGARKGAYRARDVARRLTPKDQGGLRDGWEVDPGADEFIGSETRLADLVQTAPHAIFVELGTRPHGVNPAGWAAIYEWVRRHYRGGQLGGTGPMRRARGGETGPYRGPDPVIADITNAVVAKIRKEGTKPTYFIRDMLPELSTVCALEVERALALAEMSMSRSGS
jgi:hypothetical protein